MPAETRQVECSLVPASKAGSWNQTRSTVDHFHGELYYDREGRTWSCNIRA